MQPVVQPAVQPLEQKLLNIHYFVRPHHIIRLQQNVDDVVTFAAASAAVIVI